MNELAGLLCISQNSVFVKNMGFSVTARVCHHRYVSNTQSFFYQQILFIQNNTKFPINILNKIVLAGLLYISQNSVLVKNMGFSESQPEFIIIDINALSVNCFKIITSLFLHN